MDSSYASRRLKQLMDAKKKAENEIAFQKIVLKSLNKEIKICRDYCNNPPLKPKKMRKEYYNEYGWE